MVPPLDGSVYVLISHMHCMELTSFVEFERESGTGWRPLLTGPFDSRVCVLSQIYSMPYIGAFSCNICGFSVILPSLTEKVLPAR
jgi:hypothetical protein